jgi:hypothetical protein
MYTVVSITPLGPTKAPGFSDLRLLKGETAIENPHLATVRFVNNGDVPILASDFAGPLTIRISGFAQPGALFKGKSGEELLVDFTPYKGPLKQGIPVFRDARVAGAKPENIPVTLSVAGNVVTIAPLLLNPSDEFIVELLVSGSSPSLVADARVAGIKAIELQQPGSNMGRRLSGAIYFVVAVALTVISLLIIATRQQLMAKSVPLPPFLDRIGSLFAMVITAISAGLLMARGLQLFGLDVAAGADVKATVAILVAVIVSGVSAAIAVRSIRKEQQ